MAVPTLPPPAMATLTAVPPCRHRRRRRRAAAVVPRRRPGAPHSRRSSSSAASLATIRVSTSPSWPTSSLTSRRGSPARVTATRLAWPGMVSSRRRLPAQRVGQRALDQDAARRWSRSTRRPRSSGSSRRMTRSMVQVTVATVRDAEALVDLGPPGVVDAGHDVGDAVVLPGDPGGEDVRVVPAGHRGQRPGLDRAPARSRSSRSKPEPTMASPGHPAGRRRKARGALSTMDTVWPWSTRLHGEARAHPPASHHDDVHGPTPPRPPGC